MCGIYAGEARQPFIHRRSERTQGYARVIPDREVPHAQRLRRPMVIVRKAARIEDLNDGGSGRHWHHQQMLENAQAARPAAR